MTTPSGRAAHWNRERQGWDYGTPPPARYTGPMPPRPVFVPRGGAEPPLGPRTGPIGPPAPDGPGAVRGDFTAPDGLADIPAPPGPVPGPRRRRQALVAGGAVVVLAAAAGGGYLLWGGGKPAPAHAAHHATSSSGLPTAPATATDATGPTAATDVPTDYRLVHDQAGFTLAVPRDWQRTERANGVFYTAPDQHGLVQIFQDQHPTETPREALEKTSQQLSHSAANPNYEEVSLAPLTDQAPGADAVQLIYAYDSKDVGERVKVVDCAFTATDGRQFAVLVRGTDAEWPHQEDIQRIALRTFAATG